MKLFKEFLIVMFLAIGYILSNHMLDLGYNKEPENMLFYFLGTSGLITVTYIYVRFVNKIK